MSGCQKASSQLILCPSSILRHLLMKSLASGERLLLILSFWVWMALTNCSQLLATQGVLPCSISQKMSPIDHRSDLLVYFCLCSSWGDMYSGVPTIDFITADSLSMFLAKPKSLILHYLPLKSILAGLRSRWVTFLLLRYLTPSMICLKQSTASFSSSLLRSRRQVNMSWSHSSVMMYMLLLVCNTSCSSTILSCLTFFMMSISQCRFLRLKALLNSRLSMTLTATGWLLSITRPRQTEAQEPCPSSRRRLKMYLSMRFSCYIQRIQLYTGHPQ